jgi:hypothetical protein
MVRLRVFMHTWLCACDHRLQLHKANLHDLCDRCVLRLCDLSHAIVCISSSFINSHRPCSTMQVGNVVWMATSVALTLGLVDFAGAVTPFKHGWGKVSDIMSMHGKCVTACANCI